ncbi:hypothetical protein BOX15_Mlig021756g2, partial [Macrostomum lignano]
LNKMGQSHSKPPGETTRLASISLIPSGGLLQWLWHRWSIFIFTRASQFSSIVQAAAEIQTRELQNNGNLRNHKLHEVKKAAALSVAAVTGIGLYYSFTKEPKGSEHLLDKGNRLKISKNWREAGQAFEAAAEQFSKQRRCELDAANNYSEAANCYRKLPDTRPKAVRCLQQAAEMYAEQGQFSIAARQLEEAGDLLASSQQVEEAIGAYVRAADFWSGEDSPASAAGSRAKAAELTADCGRLTEAAAVFEDLGVSAEQHSLLSFGAKDHLAKSCLCLLCSGAAGVGEKAEQLAVLCGSFKDTDELSLVRSLASATDARDVAAVDAAVSEFERFNNLDDFARRRLDDLKKIVSGERIQLA